MKNTKRRKVNEGDEERVRGRWGKSKRKDEGGSGREGNRIYE